VREKTCEVGYQAEQQLLELVHTWGISRGLWDQIKRAGDVEPA